MPGLLFYYFSVTATGDQKMLKVNKTKIWCFFQGHIFRAKFGF